MKMTPIAVVAGSLIILAAIVFVVIILPYVHTNQTQPSEIFRQRTLAEAAGREVLAISSATGQGLDALRRAVAVELDRREPSR